MTVPPRPDADERRELKPRVLLRLASVLVVLGACGAAAYWLCSRLFRPRQPLPSLLKGASAGFGHPSDLRNQVGSLAWECGSTEPVSPELEQRLREQFPPGSSETSLVAALRDQGFTTPSACSASSSVQIRFSRFVTPKDSPMYVSSISWGVDDKGQIVWTHGFVFFDSL